jgi:hypothetical protein
MKVSMLLSTAITTFLWVGHTRADLIPEPTADIRTCQAWAETHKGTIHYEPAAARCLALANCMENRSANRAELRECIFEAESQYESEIAERQSQAVTAPSDLNVPIVTEASGSDIELNPAGKGYESIDARQAD